MAELKKTVQDAVKALAEQMLARQADDVAKMAPVVAALQQATEELKAQAQTLTTATATAATTAAAPPPPPPPPTVADYWQLPPPPPMHHHHRMTQPQYHTAHKTPRTAQPAHYRHHYYHGDEAYTPPRLHTAVGSSRYTVATATTPFRRPRLTTRVPAGGKKGGGGRRSEWSFQYS